MILDRRAFLRSMGLVGASSLVSCDGAPLETLYSYLTPPENIVPGVAAYYASVCRACPAGCGILAVSREARPVKLEGNPLHPINRGTLCSRGQAFLQSLYSPLRVKEPLARNTKGELKPLDWDGAMALAVERIGSARSWGIISGLQSGSMGRLIDEIGESSPGSIALVHEVVGLTSLAKASGMLLGREEVPRIDLEGVDVLVSLGAGLLDAFVSPVQFSRQWAQLHGVFRGKRRLYMEYIGPRRNLTATAADDWHRVPPQHLGHVALALAHGLFRAKRGKLPQGQAQRVGAVLERLGQPRATALPEEALRGMVDRLARAQRGVVLYGGAEAIGDQATAVQGAIIIINILTASLGTALRYGEDYALSRVDSTATILEAVSGGMEALVVLDSNPAYTLPGGAAVTEGLARANLVVLAHEHSETTALADLVLPVHHPLESWGDYEVTRRIRGIMQPVRAPLYNTRHPGDLMLELMARVGRPLPYGDFKELMGRRWLAQPEEAGLPGRIEEILVQGGVFEEARGPFEVPELVGSGELPALSEPWEPPDGQATLLAPLSSSFYDGRGAVYDWLLEVPDSLTQTAWELPVEVSVDVARAAGVDSGDRVTLTSPFGAIQGQALVMSDMAPRTVALPMGGGRELGRERINAGNVMTLLGSRLDKLSGELALVQTSVTLTRVAEDRLVSVAGSNVSVGRHLSLAMELEDLEAGRMAVLTRHGEVITDEVALKPLPLPTTEEGGTHPPDNMVVLPRHPDHRWGMTIDLDLCTGCGACVVACYAENNVPVVGKGEVARGRQLSWIRVEKHIFPSEGPKGRVRFLVVPCQHCVNAPCEPVCPVFATYHTQDGLNAQIYNRCVGTRYCANNCPYKVRRFNYFDYAFPAPLNQQLNPDVAVRSRGVMEKCTFCVQRIREVQRRAKSEGRPIRDGEIVPACVQTCPTGALTFGDFKEGSWEMTRRSNDPRSYRLLDYIINTRPSVVYLRRVYSRVEA